MAVLQRSCHDAGLTLEGIENVPHRCYDKVMTGQDGRDEQLDNLCRTLRAVAAAEVPIFGYHFNPTMVWRTAMVKGRGGAQVSAFDLDDSAAKGSILGPSTSYPELSLAAERMWDNYRYFADVVFPLAESLGLRLALHPDDPPVEHYGNVPHLFWRPENFEKAWEVAHRSTAWGLDLCLGTVSEMDGGPLAVDAMIDKFGPTGRIFYVHFRQVQGTVPHFQECFIGEGNYDPVTVMRRLADSGFDGFILDDHVPHMVGDPPDRPFRAHAHAIGYLQALVSATSPA